MKRFTLVSKVWFGVWETSDGRRMKQSNRVGSLPLIRHLVVYESSKDAEYIGEHDAEIAEVLPWTQAAHDALVGQAARFQPDPECFTLELTAYKRLRDRKLLALVRGKVTGAESGVAESLIRAYPGRVDPAVLFAFGASADHVRLARVLFLALALMKQHRLVWLPTKLAAPMLIPELGEALVGALASGLLVSRGQGEGTEVALAWAALQHRAVNLEHEDGAGIIAAAKWDGTKTKFDFNRSVDVYVDNGIVPITMCSPVHPTPPAYHSCTLKEMGGWSGMCEKLAVDTCKKRILVVGERGNLEPKGMNLVKLLDRAAPFKRGDVCLLERKGKGFYCITQGEKQSAPLTLDQISELCVPAARALYDDLGSIPANAYDGVVVAVGGEHQQINARWGAECIRIAQGNPDCVLYIG